jgi:hypothetical protein
MRTYRTWEQYPQTYRSHDIKILADWIIGGTSGSVVGLPGVGKSNFLGFLCHRPEVIQLLLAPHQIKVVLIPIDLNNLPDDTIATFYRVILRAFHENRDHFDQTLQQSIDSIYQENKATCDPFLAQSALRELLVQFRERKRRVGFVFDRFDDFCQAATSPMTNSLRGLRDSFKETLFYIMGMRQEAAYLPDPSTMGELYEILDTHVHWVGPMNRDDARSLIEQEIHSTDAHPIESDVDAFIKLSGGFPSLLKVICNWWQVTPDRGASDKWLEVFLNDSNINYRLQEILTGLSQEELLILSEVEKISSHRERQISLQKLDHPYRKVLNRLMVKGICELSDTRWRISSELLAFYLAKVKGRGRGRIWLNEETEEAYQGKTLIQGLTPLEREVLHFLLRHTRVRHTKTDIIVNAWPDELKKEGVTDDSLYQVIVGLRKKIEPISAKPCYIINWRGKPEGGYQLFPEGRPA